MAPSQRPASQRQKRLQKQGLGVYIGDTGLMMEETPTYGKVVKDAGQPQTGRSLSATAPKCPLQSLMVQRPKGSQEHLNILVNCFLIYPQVLLIH